MGFGLLGLPQFYSFIGSSEDLSIQALGGHAVRGGKGCRSLHCSPWMLQDFSWSSVISALPCLCPEGSEFIQGRKALLVLRADLADQPSADSPSLATHMSGLSNQFQGNPVVNRSCPGQDWEQGKETAVG